jgi:hypothetical protein
MTVLEQQVLEAARHYIPEIAKQLERIADNLEAFAKFMTDQVKEG